MDSFSFRRGTLFSLQRSVLFFVILRVFSRARARSLSDSFSPWVSVSSLSSHVFVLFSRKRSHGNGDIVYRLSTNWTWTSLHVIGCSDSKPNHENCSKNLAATTRPLELTPSFISLTSLSMSSMNCITKSTILCLNMVSVWEFVMRKLMS